MPKTRINCPNCRQPVLADVDQLFDVGVDPSAKSRLLSGSFNLIQCPACGFHGNLSTAIVYHDPQKELLLTFFPSELGLPRDEQERIIGPLINKVVNSLPQEKRKGYLLRPQAVLTLQGLVERILEGDGITREMLQAQQQRLNLLQRLMEASSDDARAEIARKEDQLIDADFFNMLRRVSEMAYVNGDQESSRRLNDIQKQLMSTTTFGRELQAQNQEVEAAVRSLQAHGKELTRENLLELVIQAPNDIRLSALVSLARPGMDYTFFGMLSERIERSVGDEKEQLVKLREHILEMTREIDLEMAERAKRSRQLLNAILTANNVTEAIEQNLPVVDDFFLQALNQELEEARKKGDLERIAKLHEVEEVLKKASAPPPEITLIEELMDTPDDQALRGKLESHKQEITPEFINTLTSLISQMQSDQDPELYKRLQTLYQMVLRLSMEANLKR